MGLIARLRREYIQVTGILRTLRRAGHVKPNSAWTAADMIEPFVRKTPDATAIYFENRTYTYRQYGQAANQYARWVLAQGIKRGERVALVMENRPEYLFAWLGIVKTGAVAALINTNLRGESLAASLAIADVQHVIVGAELCGQLLAARSFFKKTYTIWTTGGVYEGTRDLDIELSCQSPDALDSDLRKTMTAKDKCFLVYTSGTTGLPKAANISHMRFATMAYAFSAIANAKPSDRIYVTLPLYHTSGGITAIGTTLAVGGAVILKRKFSAHQFWEDCEAYGATLFQYIGELCRYLLNTPPNPAERRHKIRMAIGNGLRPEIWKPFQERFAIPHIVEFYGSTEGNVALVNFDDTVGAVGRVPSYLDKLFGVKIVRFNIETETIVRAVDGHCIECAPDEIGEVVGKINFDPQKARGTYEGYTDSAASEKKILRNAFENGDAWFRTGDLMKKDKNGYFYFVDRIGDTFRWKGENVSTGEVAQAIGSYPHVKEANVYGVAVPGSEGRAGMAALVVDPEIDLNGLHVHLEHALPAYARPIFLRVQPEIDATGTFKQKKTDLVHEGFDPTIVKDPLYFDHPKMRGYVPLTEQVFREIIQGLVKL